MARRTFPSTENAGRKPGVVHGEYKRIYGRPGKLSGRGDVRKNDPMEYDG